MKNKWLRISFCFLISLTLIFSMCPISYASTMYFRMPFAKPQLTGNDFYVETLLYNSSTGDYKVKTTYVVSNLEMTYTDSALNVDNLCVKVILNSGGIEFYSVDLGSQYFNVVIVEMLETGKVNYYNADATTQGSAKIYGLGHGDYGSGYVAVENKVYGNVSEVVDNVNPNNQVYEYAVIYEEVNSINQSIAQVISALAVIAQVDTDIKNKLDTVLSHLTNIENDSAEMLVQLQNISDIANDVLDKLSDYEQYIDDIEGVLDVMSATLTQIEMYMLDVLQVEGEQLQQLQQINQKLQTIINILNAGKDQPTLVNPNDSIDSAFGDVSGWFGEIDGFGDQLEHNRQDNQENLAQAGNIINGFFSVVPPQILVALAFCAIMIVVAKVIGR